MQGNYDLYSQTALFPDSEVRLLWDDFLTRELSHAHERVISGRVVPRFDRGVFQKELATFDFERPREIDAILPWVITQMETGIVHVTHPRYLGLFNPAPTFPSQCADRIAAVFNPQLASATTSPAPCEIESHTIRAVARRIGLAAQAGGHFTSGGSEANYTALICALTQANPKFAAEGTRAFPGAPVFYVSRECHLAWLKIAHQAGIGRDAVRFLGTDGSGRMDCDELTDTIRYDRLLGYVPVMIVATAGTTGGGMIDPLKDCATVARRAGLWYHVDAAWGGALIASDRLRHSLDGMEQAASITLDAHKWLATSMGCGMFICADQSALSSAFGLTASFMPPSARPEFDPYVTTMQWSRRFLGLRLFVSLAVAGWSGYGAHVEKSVALVALLENVLVARGWHVANESPLAVLCLDPPSGSADVRAIVDRVVASGRAWVSATMFEGRDVLRACVTHGDTTAQDILVVADALQAAL
ncbi:MAG: pyridoxal-dependent decarboxylase [Rhodospirillales bacterium]|nr:pyridoxal-dependent decarboxylase [Rhodospirillales bacterium]